MMQVTETIEPRTRRFSYDEYYQMADMGFFRDQRVELVDGEIVEMAPQGNFHAMVIGLCEQAMRRVFPSGHWIRQQLPLRFQQQHSEPEPDLSVVVGSPRDYANGHPETAILVIEVSESSATFDRSTKASLYAAAGIADYWVVHIQERKLEIFRKSVSAIGEKFAFRYAEVREYKSSDTVAALAAPSMAITVHELLP
jgi:Uma2 family endonuclease